MNRLTLSLAALTISAISAPAMAEAPPCPSGQSGDWKWQALESGIELFYTGGRWQLMSEEGVSEANPTTILLAHNIRDDGTKVSFFGASDLPKGLTAVGSDGRAVALFGAYSHRYSIALARVGGDIELQGQVSYNTATLGVFGRKASTDLPAEVAKFEDMVTQSDQLGLILQRKDPIYLPDSTTEIPLAYTLLPANGREIAFNTALAEQKRLDGKDCKPVFYSFSMKPDQAD